MREREREANYKVLENGRQYYTYGIWKRWKWGLRERTKGLELEKFEGDIAREKWREEEIDMEGWEEPIVRRIRDRGKEFGERKRGWYSGREWVWETEKEEETEEATEGTALGVRRGDEGQEFENVEMGERRRRREKEDMGLDKSRESGKWGRERGESGHGKFSEWKGRNETEEVKLGERERELEMWSAREREGGRQTDWMNWSGERESCG